MSSSSHPDVLSSSPRPSPPLLSSDNLPPEEACSATTLDRKYYKQDNWFAKRCLCPSEYWTGPYGLIIPRAPMERIRNEAASLKFIQEETNVPAPKIYGAFEHDGTFWLITEYVEGVDLAELPEKDKLRALIAGDHCALTGTHSFIEKLNLQLATVHLSWLT